MFKNKLFQIVVYSIPELKFTNLIQSISPLLRQYSLVISFTNLLIIFEYDYTSTAFIFNLNVPEGCRILKNRPEIGRSHSECFKG